MAGPTLVELSRRLNARRLPPLLLLTDARRLTDPLPAAARLPRGAGVVLRHYGEPGRAALAARLARLARARGLKLIVAGDLALARAVGAHGLHLPERAPRPPGARPRGFLLTVAAHSLPALR